MGWRWLVGPPGSGKTERAVALARRTALGGGRVAWIGLPAQRPQVLRRWTAEGPLLGAAFLTFQQLALQQLGRAGALRPQVAATARLALVAEALIETAGALPTPGEARLFAQAIAEAKRHGLGPGALAALAAAMRDDAGAAAGEVDRLAAVAEAYERRKGDAWDDDDVRAAALAAALAAAPAVLRGWLGADLVVVDGWREVPAADLPWLERIAEAVEVVVTGTTEPPATVGEVERLDPRVVQVEAWRFANPVAEVRWVLRSLARDLADGLDPRDLAVVAPRGAARALAALAGEFGVELVDERPRALVETPFGRLLVDLLELPEHPTATRLLAVPDLVPLGRRALAEGLTGRDALARVAAEEGLASTWEAWTAALAVGDDPLAWARTVVAVVADLAGDAPDAAIARAQEGALRRAQEAARLAGGEGFRAWWLALLRASTLRERARPGIALFEPARAAGRRFRRAYLVGAVAGAYDLGEREDYFVPEERRAAPGGEGLPRRQRGLDPAWRAELLARADRVTVTCADGDRSGPLRPDDALVGAARDDPPAVPSSSRLEAQEPRPFAPGPAGAPTGVVPVETLRRAATCPFQAWAGAWPDDDRSSGWAASARRRLVADGADAAARAALGRDHPALAPWLDRYAPVLAALRFGVEIAEDGVAVHLDALDDTGALGATLDGAAADRPSAPLRVVRFALPDEAPDDMLRPDRRWNELIAADLLLRRRGGPAAARVDLVAWPLGEAPRSVTPDGVGASAFVARLRRLRGEVAASRRAWLAGPPAPAPGFACRDCAVADLCREGTAAA